MRKPARARCTRTPDLFAAPAAAAAPVAPASKAPAAPLRGKAFQEFRRRLRVRDVERLIEHRRDYATIADASAAVMVAANALVPQLLARYRAAGHSESDALGFSGIVMYKWCRRWIASPVNLTEARRIVASAAGSIFMSETEAAIGLGITIAERERILDGDREAGKRPRLTTLAVSDLSEWEFAARRAERKSRLGRIRKEKIRRAAGIKARGSSGPSLKTLAEALGVSVRTVERQSSAGKLSDYIAKKSSGKPAIIEALAKCRWNGSCSIYK